MRLATTIFLLLLVTGLFQNLYFVPQMPPKVASHFDGAGNANGWSSRSSFATMHAVTFLFLGALFGALPWLFGVIPPSLINMPHREYWLAPERRKESLAYLSVTMMWFGVVMMLFMLVIMQLTIDANVSGSGRLDPVSLWSSLALLLGYILVWVVKLYRRFPKPAMAQA